MNRILATGLVLLALRAAAFTPQVNVGGRQVTFSWSTPGFSSSTEVAWGPSSAASFDAYPNHSAFSAPISVSASPCNLSARGSFVATEDPVGCLSDVVTDLQTSTPDAGTSSDAGTAGHRGPLDLGWSCTATGAAWSTLALLPLLAWLARRRAC